MPPTSRGGWSASTISRRALLTGMAAVGLSACLPGTWRGPRGFQGLPDPAAPPGLPDGLFTLGVASGDPTPDGVVLWSRLAPDPLAGGGMPDGMDVIVRWQLARDEAMTDLVADGATQTGPSVAHSLHVDVSGLEPGTTYFYRFTTGGQSSPVGRTRTAPAAGTPVDHVRLAVATCQNYTHGHFHAWSQVVADQPDLVIFLGDYIYEGGFTSSGVRNHNSPEIVSLADYRNRHALYRGDPQLQEAHRVAPWVLTWDDHEVENNHAGLIPQDRADDPIFVDRRTAAYQAYWEHLPLRAEPEGIGLAMHRSLRWGDLVDLFVLDGRQHRDDQPCGADIGQTCDERVDPSRTMLGVEQLAWLQQGLAAADARWTVLANQTVMTPMPIGTAYNLDQWDGYVGERSVVLDHLAGVRNPVVLTGDFHAAGVGHLREEPAGSPVVGTELITTSISSRASSADIINSVVRGLDQFPYFEARWRGYLRCDITPERWDADFVVVDAVAATPGPATVDAAWSILDGQPIPVPR